MTKPSVPNYLVTSVMTTSYNRRSRSTSYADSAMISDKIISIEHKSVKTLVTWFIHPADRFSNDSASIDANS